MNTSYSLLPADLLTQQLDQTMQQTPHDWYQTQHSKRCVTTSNVPQTTAGYPVASSSPQQLINATTDPHKNWFNTTNDQHYFIQKLQSEIRNHQVYNLGHYGYFESEVTCWEYSDFGLTKRSISNSISCYTQLLYSDVASISDAAIRMLAYFLADSKTTSFG
ncbi:hypothetical protein F511_42389 [Dorcoceras hygrometricum]|uniref:Uncharacterized protein n=1 Tax=Dorcoceras hygrometricum TaxID=472368 RepID=A0A2Z7ASZ7_9LAMI|nr:hypothetical protein F511_42389 [Dorcoceras hygrometricum]